MGADPLFEKNFLDAGSVPAAVIESRNLPKALFFKWVALYVVSIAETDARKPNDDSRPEDTAGIAGFP